MANLPVFAHPEFGKVRIITRNGEPWFVASDVAKALGYEKPNNAINDHCKKVSKFSYPESRQLQPYNIIPEMDVYRLIMRSIFTNFGKNLEKKFNNFTFTRFGERRFQGVTFVRQKFRLANFAQGLRPHFLVRP